MVVGSGLWWFVVVSLKFSRKYHVTHYLTRVQDSVSNLILNETLWWFVVVCGGLWWFCMVVCSGSWLVHRDVCDVSSWFVMCRDVS